MKAIGYQKSLPTTDPRSLVNIELPKPIAKGRDLLIRIQAVSVNSIDTIIRQEVNPSGKRFKVLGWDAAGIVDAVGPEASMFQPGDKVWYAGAIDRAGTNAEYHLVDERIVAKMPDSLCFTEAAALPLTSLTSWELLFNRFKFSSESTGTLLIIGASGGVGSIMIQLAKKLTKLRVIATASRQETKSWVKALGADNVIDHYKPLSHELEAIGLKQVDYIASLTNTYKNMHEIAKIIAPQGALGVIDSPKVLDITPLKRKSISVHWELIFTRSLFETEDILEQQKILSSISKMVDQQDLNSTVAYNFGEINAANLIKAHALLESGNAKGKVVLSGFNSV